MDIAEIRCELETVIPEGALYGVDYDSLDDDFVVILCSSSATSDSSNCSA